MQPGLPWSAGEGGEVAVDLAPAAWSPLYGKVTDRFGVTWVLSVAPAG